MNKKDIIKLDEILLEQTTEYKKFNEAYDILKKRKKKKQNIIIVFSIIVVTLIILIIYLLLNLNYTKREVIIDNIKVISYDDNNVKLEITPKEEETYCAYSKTLNDKLEYKKMDNNKCIIDINIGSFYIYFKNNKNITTKEYLIDNYIININIKDNYYLSINGEKNIKNNITKYGDDYITYEIENKNVLKVEEDKLIGLSKGTSKVSMLYHDKVLKDFTVTVTDTITKVPKKFDTKKKYLPCKAYSNEEAELLDTILEDRINDVGLNTRAGVVEAARFLLLEFPYRITYFFENGRLDVSGVNYVDGEGRYYHKGLYLSKEKENNIKYTFVGPAMWGCPLRNFESTSLFTKYKDYPNGLDCSGFVSWTLVNGGFDPGDLGAGNSELDPRELSDLGEYKKLTSALINSDEVKVGDLLNVWGHIAILVGIDEKNYYVAESLDILGGVVIKTYSKETVNRTFPYVVLMDSYYKEDGKLTNMWY